MNNKYFTLISLIFVFCISCNKDESKITELSNPNNDPKVFQLGQIIAKSLKNSDVSNFIQTEALKQFDGDNNFILALAYDKKIGDKSGVKSKENTFLATLSSYNKQKSDKTKTSTLEATSLFKELEQEYPLMQVAIPEAYAECEDGIDFAKNPPHVVILPHDFDEKTTKSLTAIDNNGNSYLIDATEPPLEPVVVISENERFIAIPKNTTGLKRMREPDFETDDHYYYRREKYIEDDEDSYGGGYTPPIIKIYDRDKNDNLDNLLKAKFISKSALRSVEKWVQGKPEVRLTVVFANNNSGSDQLGTLTKRFDKHGWYHRKWFKLKIDTKTLNVSMLQWNKNEFGDRMKYVFIEEDADRGSKDIEVVLTSKIDDKNTINTKTTLKAKKNDDPMGEALVQYTNPTAGEGTKHSTGIFEFWINQK